jgi:hypothetical protein
MKSNFHNKGWRINAKSLWRKSGILEWDEDRLFENDRKDIACLFYQIDEYRMGFYGALVSCNSHYMIGHEANQSQNLVLQM